MNQTNHTALIEAGHATRFGPNWPGKRCLAKTRRGTLCQNPATCGPDRAGAFPGGSFNGCGVYVLGHGEMIPVTAPPNPAR